MCVCRGVGLSDCRAPVSLAVREAAVAPSGGSFKDYCRGGKEAINLRLENGIQRSFKAF